jgi:hypothetical protein
MEQITKSIDLQKGEELREFINATMKAVRKLSLDNEDDGGPMMLHGIFSDHLVLRQMGGDFFKTDFTRKPDGSVVLGKLERVRMSFTPVAGKKVAKVDSEAAELVADLI